MRNIKSTITLQYNIEDEHAEKTTICYKFNIAEMGGGGVSFPDPHNRSSPHKLMLILIKLKPERGSVFDLNWRFTDSCYGGWCIEFGSSSEHIFFSECL